jgi:hypothetical protein
MEGGAFRAGVYVDDGRSSALSVVLTALQLR